MDNQTSMIVNMSENGTSLAQNMTSIMQLIISLQTTQRKIRNVFIVFYIITFIFGLFGNALVIYIIGYFVRERIKSVANYYIWSLAFADILYVLSLPLFCWASYLGHWPFSDDFGNVTCKLAYSCRDMTKVASALILVALSIDRCLASFYNIQKLRAIKSGKIVIMTIWIISTLLSLHSFAFAKTINSSCKLDNASYGLVWAILQLLVSYILPSFGMCIAYTILFKRMQRQMLVRKSSTSSVTNPSRTMTRTVFAVAVTFTLCQTPYHISQIVYMTKSIPLDYAVVVIYVNAVSQILVFAASCCNPIIYGLLNHNFRKYCQFNVSKCFVTNNIFKNAGASFTFKLC